MANKDWCTKFPERWPRWVKPWKWKVIDISEGCKEHDNVDDPKGGCSSTPFFKFLFKNKVVGAFPIFIIASVACWVKYPFKMFRRV